MVNLITNKRFEKLINKHKGNAEDRFYHLDTEIIDTYNLNASEDVNQLLKDLPQSFNSPELTDKQIVLKPNLFKGQNKLPFDKGSISQLQMQLNCLENMKNFKEDNVGFKT